jgi:hypothetical protein
VRPATPVPQTRSVASSPNSSTRRSRRT